MKEKTRRVIVTLLMLISMIIAMSASLNDDPEMIRVAFVILVVALVALVGGKP